MKLGDLQCSGDESDISQCFSSYDYGYGCNRYSYSMDYTTIGIRCFKEVCKRKENYLLICSCDHGYNNIGSTECIPDVDDSDTTTIVAVVVPVAVVLIIAIVVAVVCYRRKHRQNNENIAL